MLILQVINIKIMDKTKQIEKTNFLNENIDLEDSNRYKDSEIMKLKAIVLFLFTIFVLNPVFANQIQESIINVDMQAKKEVAPDTAVIRFFVENSGINLADLKAKANSELN